MRCESSGALLDLARAVASRLNMTVSSFKDPDDDWGLFPRVTLLHFIFLLAHLLHFAYYYRMEIPTPAATGLGSWGK